ncbi:zinc-binding dehydrogenase [Paeniglutamicibacter sulfureus]|nr:zinc-binding dehydrogenase [Paeniglutamicibacter sulfureus]
MVGGLPAFPGQTAGDDFFNCTHALSVSTRRLPRDERLRDEPTISGPASWNFCSVAAVGVGTITTVEETEAAIAGGAGFIVTLITDTDTGIVAAAVAAGIPVYPGGMTPTELFAGWKAGATAVKISPASQVGQGFLNDLRGLFPNIQAVPSGGVGVAEAVEWIRAGALAVSVGCPLLGDAFKGVADSVGVDETFNILQGAGPGSLGHDVSVEAAGAAASLQTVLDATRRGGTVVQREILPKDKVSISLSELGLRELTVFGSQLFETELDEAVELLAGHPFLAQIISHDFPLHEAEAAFAMALDSAASSKVVIKVGALEA